MSLNNFKKIASKQIHQVSKMTTTKDSTEQNHYKNYFTIYKIKLFIDEKIFPKAII
jgi:hypothetical protein